MQNKHESILRAVNNNSKKYNIFTFPTHERYQANLGLLEHTFYLYQGEGIKPWKPQYAPLPKNHILLDGTEYQIAPDMKFDIVLCQGKHHFNVSKSVSEHLNIPLVCIEHTLPFASWSVKQIKNMSNIKGDINIFISQYSIKQWQFDENDPSVRIIEHAVNTDVFNNNDALHKDGKILTVANDYKDRNWCLNFDLYQNLTNGLPTNPVGDTPNFSKAATNIEDLVNHYKQASVFLNTSKISPIPTSLLEAMACGCPVVSTATCMIPEIIEDGVNGFCSNDEDYLREKLIWCLKNPSSAKIIGEKARETILNRFTLEKHLKKWNDIFNEVYGRGHG